MIAGWFCSDIFMIWIAKKKKMDKLVFLELQKVGQDSD